MRPWELVGAYTTTRNATAAIKMALARNSSRLMTAAFFADGWVVPTFFRGMAVPDPSNGEGARLTTGGCRSRSVRVRHEVVDDLLDDVVRKLDGQFVGMDCRHGARAEHRM